MAASTNVQIGWQDYLTVAVRRRQFFLIPLITCLVLGLLVCLFAPRIYQATALIAIKNEKLINPLIQGLAMPTDVSERLNTLREEILSWSNLNRLIREHNLDHKLQKNSQIAYERLVRELREDIRVRMKGTSLIQVSYEGREPSTVQQMVNSLTDIVIERDSVIQEQEAANAVSFIEAELTVYRQKLEESEKKLREFKEVYMTQMPVATALNDELKELEVLLSRLLVDNTEEHPRVLEVKRTIEEVRKRRDEEIRRLIAKGVIAQEDADLAKELFSQIGASPATATDDPAVQRAQEAYEGVVAGLEAPSIPELTPTQIAISAPSQGGATIQLNDAAATSVTLAPRQQQELARLTRDYSVNETIYRGLLEKLERAKITGRLGEDKEGGKFEVIERARFPVKPVRPVPLQMAVIALIVGIALGTCAVVLAEYLDQSLQSSEEAAEFLELPVLGAISTIVTPADLEERRRRRQQWTSWRDLSGRFKHGILQPVWSRLDRTLVRWGL